MKKIVNAVLIIGVLISVGLNIYFYRELNRVTKIENDLIEEIDNLGSELEESKEVLKSKESEIVDLEDGVNRSGTFNYICKKCDGTFFQDYENPNNIEKYPTDKMLAEIAVKNILLQISKRAVEKQL